jgi:RND family efflux transporter MFP subunit
MQPSNREILNYRAPRGLRLGLIVFGGVMAAVVVVGVLGRVSASQGLKKAVENAAVPTVELVSAKSDKAARELTLPADVQAFDNATTYARVSGYLKRWYPDIGARVHRGQLLAEIDTPDLDQQLARLRADLNTAIAQQRLSASTEQRWKALLAADGVSQQEYDEKAGDLAVKTSLVAAARANLAQLEATAGFKRVVAPFDGVVTQRATDIGSLVTAGSAGAPLYTIADARRLRIYVRIPQSYTPQIHPGMQARLLAPERPKDVFIATVVNDAQAINAQSGTMLVQLQINNADGRLKPGQYVQAEFSLPAAADTVTLPATALMYRAAGPQVAIVDAQGKVKLRNVVIGKDFGSKVQIASGVTANQKVIDNPPDAVLDGDTVKVVASSRKAPANG